MRLAARRVKFSRLLAKLVLAAGDQGMNVAFDEVRVFKTRVGLDPRGVKLPFTDRIHTDKSLHYQGLAADLILWDKDWNYLTDTESYELLGDVWKSYDPECTWGGDFSRPDGNHFSIGER